MVTYHIIIYVPTTNMSLKCHIYKLVHMQIWHNYIRMCLIWTHCNQLCDHKHWYTYITHYWHLPVNKYVCHTAYMSPTTLLLYFTYRSNTTAHISEKYKINLPCYCHICGTNKYVPLMPQICHMPNYLTCIYWESMQLYMLHI